MPCLDGAPLRMTRERRAIRFGAPRMRGGRAVHVAVYSDLEYGRRGDTLVAQESFALFVARLREHVGRLVLVGRVNPRAGAALPHRLPAGVELLELPYYTALTEPIGVLRGISGSLVRFWRLLGDIDVVWLLGPHPLALAFALIGHARRRRVVIGVRQDMRRYVRHRHPRRRALHLVAELLELAWRALARVDATVVVGQDLAHRYRRSAVLVPIAVSLIDESDVVDLDEALARSYDGELRVLSVGRLDAEKNPLLLADVLARLLADDARWVMVVCGDGSERQALAARLSSLRVAEHADLRGALPFPELRGMYARSHVLLHASWTEGVPQVLFEAFAAGVPVVATDVGGVAAAVRRAALLVPPGDGGAAAAAVARLAGDAALRRRLVAAGLELARGQTASAECERVAAVLIGDVRRRQAARRHRWGRAMTHARVERRRRTERETLSRKVADPSWR
jgi:glycosyltransferase involved in cell wall biosynthesis